MFKGVRDAQEVENFLWHLENYFKCNRVGSNVNKINTAVLYLSEMSMLWWRHKESDIKKGTALARSSRRRSSLTTSSMRQSATLES